MLPIDSQIKDSADILKALGQLALAASQAEATRRRDCITC
jgi:hypothetical protein